MLVYVCESDKEKIMCDVGEAEIQDHLKLKFREEQEEKETKKRYKADASLCTNIKEKIMCDVGELEIRDNLKLKFKENKKKRRARKNTKLWPPSTLIYRLGTSLMMSALPKQT